jgi:hypothetical protein
MTVQEAYNKILPLLEYYIVTDLFTEYGMKEQSFGNEGMIDNQILQILESMPYELSQAERSELESMLKEEGMLLFNYYDNNINALTTRKEKLDIALPTLVEDAPELWRDVLDQSRMTDAEREYEEFIQSQSAISGLLGDELTQQQMEIAIGNLMAGDFYGLMGNPTIGRRQFGSGTIPVFQIGIETNLYADPHITQSGMTWLQDVQIGLVELGLLGDYYGDQDRTIFTPNQLDEPTKRAIQDAMGILNRSGQYLPDSETLLNDFKEAGLNTAGLEAVLQSGEAGQIAQFFGSVAASPEMKSIFHNYFMTGINNMINDKKKLGGDMQVIVTPSFEARVADAKSQWASITGGMMNPYLAAVAASEIDKIYRDVQMSEGKYMGPYGAAMSVYKKAQQDRIAGNAPSSTTKPFSDPLDIIENKIQETIMKMAVEDNAAFAAGDTQKNYGTNLWALLSSLG